MKDCMVHIQGQVTGDKLLNKYTAIQKDLFWMHAQIKMHPSIIHSGKQVWDVY